MIYNSSGATGTSSFSFLTSTSSPITASGNYNVKTLGGFQWHEIRTNFPKKIDFQVDSLKHAIHSNTQSVW